MKCENTNCCGELKTPLKHQELALQKQPTPTKQPDRLGNFYHHVDALTKLSCKPTAFTDLSCLLPHKGGDNATSSTWDKKIEKELKLRNWEAKKVQVFVTCFNCNKRQCIYSPSDTGYIGEITEL
eukprot:6310056-Ditylum_brightwellii.AAC.1